MFRLSAGQRALTHDRDPKDMSCLAKKKGVELEIVAVEQLASLLVETLVPAFTVHYCQGMPRRLAAAPAARGGVTPE